MFCRVTGGLLGWAPGRLTINKIVSEKNNDCTTGTTVLLVLVPAILVVQTNKNQNILSII